MTEKPILFSAPMVRAILDGTKTQTRRVIKPQPVNVPVGAYINPYNHDYDAFTVWTSDDKMCLHCGGDRANMAHWRSPYGKPSDHLWVREALYATATRKEGECLNYRAGGGEPRYAQTSDERFWLWKQKINSTIPSIHMPRWASRILLRVTDIGVERVQDVSREDAQAEGWPRQHELFAGINTNSKALTWFHNLWNSINAKRGYSWESNPWVWAVTFERVKP